MPDGAPVEGKPQGEAIHATAVAIARRGLLILGPSGSGKSRLAFALIAASTPLCLIRLVGDDRILITTGAGELVARPHPRIAGFIERRGLGIVAVPFVESAPVVALINLGLTTLPQNLRDVANVYDVAGAAPLTCNAVLAWWRDACTTPAAKAPASRSLEAKD